MNRRGREDPRACRAVSPRSQVSIPTKYNLYDYSGKYSQWLKSRLELRAHNQVESTKFKIYLFYVILNIIYIIFNPIINQYKQIGDLKLYKKNSIVHGLYSDCIVLNDENPKEFNDMLERFRNEYPPHGISEEETVFELASLHWKRRRLEAGLQQALNMRRASSVADASAGWDSLAADAVTMAKSQLTAAQIACERISKTVQRVVSQPDKPLDDSEAAEIEKLTGLSKELNTVSEELVIPILHIVEKQKDDQIARAYNPDILERELKIQAEFDRRIEKVLKRLVMIREYKKYYLPKSVNSKPVQIEALPAKSIGEKTDTEVGAGPLVIT